MKNFILKDKSWIIILIMGIALTISIAYSIYVSQIKDDKESTVTTKSIIEMTATTATIKNTLTGTGIIEYKEPIKFINNIENNKVEMTGENTNDIVEEISKVYQISLIIEDKDLEKVKIGQKVEISVKEDKVLNYTGKIIRINKDSNNKSTINIQVSNPDSQIQENMHAICTVIVERAEDVVALPIEAIQYNQDGGAYVDVVQEDGTTKPVNIKTGISDDYYVEIVSGLKIGDRIQIIKSSTTVVSEENNKTSKK